MASAGIVILALIAGVVILAVMGFAAIMLGYASSLAVSGLPWVCAGLKSFELWKMSKREDWEDDLE